MVQALVMHGSQPTSKDIKTPRGPRESFSARVGHGVELVRSQLQKDGSAAALGYLLQFAADTLDKDLEIIFRQSKREEAAAAAAPKGDLPSTLHVFLPHRDRGRSRKKRTIAEQPQDVPDRRLVSAIAEILIWSGTGQMMSDNAALIASFRRFLRATSDGDWDDVKSHLHAMQTIIRNTRKGFNSYARERGFMLSDQFLLDPDRLDTRKVNRGKAGDLTDLARLARKKEAARILRLIQLRHASHPAKITKYPSVRELIRNCPAAGNVDSDADDAEKLERDIHGPRIEATARYLRGLIKEHEKAVIIASTDDSRANHVAAALVAAAMSNWELSSEETDHQTPPRGGMVRLFIAGARRNLTCFRDLLDLLYEIVKGLSKNEMDAPSFVDGGGIATTKAVMNMIDRHLRDSEVLLLIGSGDIRLPDDTMKALTNRGCSIHCHDADDSFGERLRREGALKGDITISLAWDTIDDLDLHVTLPGGEEIYCGNRTSHDGLCALDVDMNAGPPYSREPVENVFLGNQEKMIQAPLGGYRVVVRNFAYHEEDSSDETVIPFRVVVEKNGAKEKFHGRCKGSSSESDVTVCEFDYEGRTVPFPKEEKEKTAFGTSDMVNMTASTGQTLESLGQLVQVVHQHEHLDAVRTLVDDDVMSDTCQGEAEIEVERPLTADRGKLEVTSRDRVNILLARLPARFHCIIGEAFGGPSLVEQCAEEISRRMIADRIPISELRRNGYPAELLVAVKAKMGTVDVA